MSLPAYSQCSCKQVTQVRHCHEGNSCVRNVFFQLCDTSPCLLWSSSTYEHDAILFFFDMRCYFIQFKGFSFSTISSMLNLPENTSRIIFEWIWPFWFFCSKILPWIIPVESFCLTCLCLFPLVLYSVLLVVPLCCYMIENGLGLFCGWPALIFSVTFSRLEPEGRLVMGFRKASSAMPSDQVIALTSCIL